MHSIVLTTCGSRKEAERIARDILDRRLVACVSILPVKSYYRWKEEFTIDHEYLLVAKTKSEVFTKLKARILALHTYELPEIVSFRIQHGYKKYLDWIDAEVRR
jgi:periplasmic divalent cation tolerance protein